MQLEASDIRNKEDWVRWLIGEKADGEFNFAHIFLHLKSFLRSAIIKSVQGDVEAFLNEETGEVPVVNSARFDDEACLEEDPR